MNKSPKKTEGTVRTDLTRITYSALWYL